MPRKLFTLRQAVLTGAAVTAGSAAGTFATAIAAHYDQPHLGVGQLTAAVTTLWILDKLNTLIDDTK